jgi:hypothetical protein
MGRPDPPFYVLDKGGNFHISESYNYRVRKAIFGPSSPHPY